MNESYSDDLVAAYGTPPFFWSTQGSLPPGLHLSSGPRATLSGLPQSAGTFNYTLGVQDGTGKTASTKCQIEVAAASRPEVTSACPLPGAQLGQPYSAMLEASGGVRPYSFSVVGSLPSGVSSNAAGEVSGTPLNSGTFPFVVQVTDQLRQSVTKNCSVTVPRPPLPTLQMSSVASTYSAAVVGPRVVVGLKNVYPAAVRGHLRLQVMPDTGSTSPDTNQADPRVKFANGQAAVTFTIPAGTREFAVAIPSTGTVADNATISVVDAQAGDEALMVLPPAQTFSVLRGIPVMTAACYTTASDGAHLNVTGYSTTRSLKTAELVLNGAKQSVNVQSVADGYFISPDSIRFGGAFTLSFPFTLPSNATSLSVSLTNSEGASAVRTVNRCQ